MNLISEHNVMFMVICMFFAGYASTMNDWIDNWDDFRFSLNDFYMVGLMTGWMFFFMGLFTLRIGKCVLGLVAVIVFFILIRTQAFITEIQYLKGMIPHHSMAIMMSKRLEKKPNSIQHLLDQIIQTQKKEIIIMKQYLNQ
jgi:thiol:disulfide interchange protein